jgi:hypothetical protein
MKNKKTFLTIIILITALFICAGVVFSQQKAILYLNPISGSYKEGKIFKVKVKINTGKNKINSARGVIKFPKNNLEVLDIGKSGSIFTFWEPTTSFSNYAGEIDFGGGLPSPGFSGQSGKILEITFRAKSAGKVKIDFQEGAILANDKKGTDVLGKIKGAEYKIIKEAIPSPVKKPIEKEFKPPEITVFPERLSSTEVLYLEGKAEPSSTVILYIEKEDEEPIIKEIRIDPDGSWSYIHNKFLQAGKYSVFAKAKNDEGEISAPSKKIYLNVNKGGVVVLGVLIKDEIIYGVIILVLFATILVLFGYLIYSQQKRSKTKMSLFKEIKEANDSVIDGFGLLKEELRREVKILKETILPIEAQPEEKEKRQIIINDLSEDLDLIEKIQTYIRKEVKDIEDTLPPLN